MNWGIICDYLFIFFIGFILYLDVKGSEKYIEDNSYDSKKNISKHILFAKFDFSIFMLSVIGTIFMFLMIFLAYPDHSRDRGIECCNKVDGTIEGNYCVFKSFYSDNYRIKLTDFGNKRNMDYRAYCVKEEDLLKQLRPNDWQEYVDKK